MMSRSKIRLVLLGCTLAFIVALSFGAMNLSADIITFDTLTPPPAGFPNNFGNAGPSQTLIIPTSIGDVVVMGGVVLANTAFLPANQTASFGTESPVLGADASLANLLTIIFPQNITNFFLNLFNGVGQPEDYLVQDNLGNSITVTVPGNFQPGASSLVAFANDTPLGNTITIVASGAFGQSGLWDFFIDNIGFNEAPTGVPIPPTSTTTAPPPPPPTAVPEPGILTLLAFAGLLGGIAFRVNPRLRS
jgi:hypothetical protein